MNKEDYVRIKKYIKIKQSTSSDHNGINHKWVTERDRMKWLNISNPKK